MTEPLFLIAHKVRNAPAFDIAIQMEMEDEIWWIIPTSGHRAYPYWSCAVDELDFLNGKHPDEYLGVMPTDWPDHYTSRTPAESKSIGGDLLAKLGLGSRPQPKIQRRV